MTDTTSNTNNTSTNTVTTGTSNASASTPGNADGGAAALTAMITANLDRHLAAYCDPDAARRAETVAAVWSDSGSLFDPPFDGTGHPAICGLTDVVLTHYPAHTFRRTTTVDLHHDRARYDWALIDPSGTTAVTGTDFARFDADGKLAEIVGFFGDPVARS